MTYSYVSHLECPVCDTTYDANKIQQLCTCGSPLLVRYDLERVRNEVKRSAIRERNPDLWRYHELLPVQHEDHVITLGEGMTPLLPMPKLGERYGLTHLYMKDESLIPTGSFKARGAAVGISKAKELGVQQFAMPTNGNAGAAWALYAARAGIKATIVMPQDAPSITRTEVSLSGAELFLVNGLISDAGKMVAEKVKHDQIYDASTLKEPYRIEGKKTMGLEIAEQLGWAMPDVILYPTGGGVGLIGIYKALQELKEIGWLAGKLPRLVAVQAEGCAPIVKAWEEKKERSEFWEQSTTVAFGINVPKALGDFLVLRALYETDGMAIAISDQELLEEQQYIAEYEGAFVCPEGAATFAAAKRLAEQGWISRDESVVVLNTGAGIKYPDTVKIEVPLLEIGESII
ncbi:threonine synthase [Paenibacillus sp. KACC 21273]|uniref:threonine synthase n=1 Tax=Paenibacillus sp. KACC 21273 TaxID=3025665 RepID=UPI0023661A88|nr:threonine synthase [Paenibacillus sp. KACC 21273]WDF53216.1 threonine synthase [Paenibacillus sp. KACC 21273]